MTRYKPGQGIRFTLTSQVNGVLTDPNALVLTVHFPDGTSVTPTPVRDSLGLWHGDAVIPVTMADGIGVARWQSSGAAVSQDALEERRFQVVKLDF